MVLGFVLILVSFFRPFFSFALLRSSAPLVFVLFLFVFFPSLRIPELNHTTAMTGEISLIGQVLPVGGLKEKILAAHRAGIKTIIAPSANRADIEENVPESVKTGIRYVFFCSVILVGKLIRRKNE